jgi:hypothetical protein
MRGAVLGIAAQHRILPLLHHLHGADRRVPGELAVAWKAAYRRSAIETMALKAELDAICSQLAAAGHEPIALKGAWLAWHAYPDPALRPTRDIDLLLDPQGVAGAHALLIIQGYRSDTAELSVEDMLRLDKHLPGLTSPRGVRVELHHRLWEVDGRMDHSAPAGLPNGPSQRTIRQDGIRFLSPADTLAHLIIHAVYDHRLDCGPLLFSDIAWLLRASQIDWPDFWALARHGGWERGARLVLELACCQTAGLPVEFPQGQTPAPSAVIEAAPDLLFQNLETRQSAGVVATAKAKGPRGLWRRVSAQRSSDQAAGEIARDLSSEGGFLGWARSRVLRTAGQLSDPDVRRQAGHLARLSQWLDTP